MKLFIYMIFILGLVASASSKAVEVELKCPLTVRVGTALKVTEKISNDDCYNTVSVSKIVVGLVGNGGGTIGVQGPYVIPLSVTRTVPKATCHATYGYVIKPGVLNLAPTVVSKIPETLTNTLALASAGVMDSSGSVTGAGTCQFTVTP